MMRKNIIFIVGATATGKTKFALELARKINGEIISCDSMQIYKGFDILSAKPGKKELQSVPHHLINIVTPKQSFDVNKFVQLSKDIISDIHKRGKIPIFVGGTGFYVDSLLNGIFQGPAKNSKIRSELLKQSKQHGPQYLYNKLKVVDRDAAKRIHPNDIRRIIRALEVYKLTKKPISKLQKDRSGLLEDKRYAVHIFGLNAERQDLYDKINHRVNLMFKKGAVREVKKLLTKGVSKVFKQALGLKELSAYLKGKISLEKARELIKQNTRHFAKRQLTWFRKNNKIHWLDVNSKNNLNTVIKEVLN